MRGALVNTVMNPGAPTNAENFLVNWENAYFSRRNLLPQSSKRTVPRTIWNIIFLVLQGFDLSRVFSKRPHISSSFVISF